MTSSYFVRGAVLAAAVWVALGLLRFKPWQRDATAAGNRDAVAVGFLPVT